MFSTSWTLIKRGEVSGVAVDAMAVATAHDHVPVGSLHTARTPLMAIDAAHINYLSLYVDLTFVIHGQWDAKISRNAAFGGKSGLQGVIQCVVGTDAVHNSRSLQSPRQS